MALLQEIKFFILKTLIPPTTNKILLLIKTSPKIDTYLKRLEKIDLEMMFYGGEHLILSSELSIIMELKDLGYSTLYNYFCYKDRRLEISLRVVSKNN